MKSPFKSFNLSIGPHVRRLILRPSETAGLSPVEEEIHIKATSILYLFHPLSEQQMENLSVQR